MTDFKFRPFLIGVVDGGLTDQIVKQLNSKLEGYPICTISISNYLKDNADNESDPENIDFELLLTHLMKILNKEECLIPTYDIKNKKRVDDQQKIEPCQIIILEGLLCFYDTSLRNLMDLKIFIDTDNDIRLAETVSKEIQKENVKINDILKNFFDKVKPCYNNFISTKKYADIILPNATGHENAVEILINYLKQYLDKIKNDEEGNIFQFINDIIEPKYKFCEDNLILKKEKSTIDFLRAIFTDFIKKSQDKEFVPIIRKSLIEMIESLLADYFEKFDDVTLIFDSDDINDINFKHSHTIFFFKTSILVEDDIKKPQYILSKDKNCNLIICSILLAPRFAHYLIGKQMNSILFVTLYFSEFFVKYEQIIKNDKTIFNEEELKKIVKQMLIKRNCLD